MELQYNGHAYSKRFSRELVTVMCAEAIPFCNISASIDWRRSSRRHLRVRDKRVGQLLQRCSGRYFWPDGERFLCRFNNRRSPPRRRTTWSPPRTYTPCAWNKEGDNTELDLYAKTHGYDREEGELSPTRSLTAV
jgi:hypothetical protein